MRDVPYIEASSYIRTERSLRFLARDARNPWAALVYWLETTEPSRESSFFDATQKFGTLMQLVLPDERPGVFVKRDAVQSVTDFGTVKRLVFKDGSALDVRYAGPRSDLYDEATSQPHDHVCQLVPSKSAAVSRAGNGRLSPERNEP
ncbi:hypothetical protein [Paraburkholderia hospita]|uniref:hypothetical protein n=1 Tax=Paraburkholderia hospita TaxID=169430 RepID=UPI00191C29F8|nr:hypothetical protein [Paraburkholderia hospita]